jgi:hypothetical protein
MSTKQFTETAIDVVKLYIKLRFVRSPGAILITTGLVLVAIATGLNFAGKLGISLSWLTIELSANSPEISDLINCVIGAPGLLLIIFGAFLLWKTALNGIKVADRKRILGVQLIGLNDGIQTPLVEAIPPEFIGQRRAIMIDVREQLKGAFRIQEALDEINRVGSRLSSEVTGMAVEDYLIFGGGLAPVPLLFQFGNILDDESHLHWMDWQRDNRKWVQSSQGTSIPAWLAPDLSTTKTGEIVLAIAVSYPITGEVLARAFPEIPVLYWGPKERLLGTIIGDDSSKIICEEFRNLLIALAEKGTSRIHMVLAAPAALVMRLGSSYDARNMLPLTIYQFEQGNSNPYPWGVNIKVEHGMKKCVIEKNLF